MSIWWLLVYLPVVGAIIGWTCKWAAIKLIFYPENFVGIGKLGWQGIVQRRAPTFAAGVADTIQHAGLDVDELLARIDPDEIADVVGPALDEAAPQIAHDVADVIKPGLWDDLAEPARQTLTSWLAAEGRTMLASIVTALKPVVVESVDVPALVVERLSGPNANRLAKLFQRVAARELQFVIYYGAVLGFLIGLLEVAGFSVLEKWWVLPLVGAFDGVVNNWLAIQMIFRPYEKKRYLGIFPYQGLFPARQAEISHEYATVLAEEVLSPEVVLAHVASNGGVKILQTGIEVVERELEMRLATVGAMAGVEIAPDTHTRAVAALMPHLFAAVPLVADDVQHLVAKRLEVASTIEARLAAMPKPEFEEILRGIFEEDETTLIAIGGVLGGLIGLLQAGALVALS